MTREEIENSSKECLVCSDIAEILQANAYSIHEQAIDDPAALQFPVIIIGRHVKIPRIPFMQFMGWMS